MGFLDKLLGRKSAADDTQTAPPAASTPDDAHEHSHDDEHDHDHGDEESGGGGGAAS